MTVLSNNVINPDDVAAHWLDVLEEMADERVDYDGNPIEPDYKDGGGSITIGNRRVRVVGSWSEVVFQWFKVGGAWSMGDYRIPLTFNDDEMVDRYGATVGDLLDEAVEFLEGWRADIDWGDLDYDFWDELGGRDGLVKVKGEGRCCRDEQGYTWSYDVYPERGNAIIAAGLYDEETGKVDWMEYGFIEGIDVLLMSMDRAVAYAVADVKERLGEQG